MRYVEVVSAWTVSFMLHGIAALIAMNHTIQRPVERGDDVGDCDTAVVWLPRSGDVATEPISLPALVPPPSSGPQEGRLDPPDRAVPLKSEEKTALAKSPAKQDASWGEQAQPGADDRKNGAAAGGVPATRGADRSEESTNSPDSARGGSDDPAAVTAKNLVLDVTDHAAFLVAARQLGLRFFVYPAGAAPEWMLEVDGRELDDVKELPCLDESVSRRAHDLTPDSWFRGVRDRAATKAGRIATGAHIVAAIPAGTDRIFLSVETAFLSALGPKAKTIRTLFGRLDREGDGYRLVIDSAR